jgi:hypothetical protein
MVMWGIYKKTMKLSFSTYFIWFVLNLIICSALILEKGNYLLSLTYMVLNLTIALMILNVERKVKFLAWEKFVILLSLACMVIWYLTNGAYAVVAASIAFVVAGIPQLIVVYRNPQLTSSLVWFLATVAALFSVLAGANWSIVERFYPASIFVFGSVGLIIWFIQKRRLQSRESNKIAL